MLFQRLLRYQHGNREDAHREHPPQAFSLRDRVQAVVLAYETGLLSPGVHWGGY
jgi:hypothetical protein